MKPEQQQEIDLKVLRSICQQYIDFVDNDEEYHEDGNHDVYIFEIAMQTIFGEDVFDWINNRQD